MKIDPGLWPALSALLDEYLDQPESSRAAWLERLSPEYAEALPALRELLDQAEAGGENFLQTFPRVSLPEDHGPEDERAYAPLAPGSTVGPYRLIRELGRGGMSIVWLSERADGLLKRQVALKLPLVLLHNSALAERFARERDILAQLTHPHIARLYDAGITASGQSYLALEYVEGEPITRYCESRQLEVRERLKLFLEVLRAVEHAHGNSIVHRDLKPSNILVTHHGQVRLLDFGIAKLLVEGEAGETELTRAGGRPLTPEYASPEQVAGKPVTKASDIYSLGVVLAELLACGRPKKTIVFPWKLPADLRTIVLHALREQPAERYATATEFAQDLERYLHDKPILARPDSLWYVARKFVLRNRMSVIPAVLTLCLGLGIALWQAERAVRAERIAGTRPSTTPAPALLLVLPFQNLGGDPSQDFASDGLTDETIQQLGRLDPARLTVLGRTTSMHYRNTRLPLDRIGHEVGVQYVVEGSLTTNGRLTVRLIRLLDGTQIWADDLSSESTGGLARGIATALHIEPRSPRSPADNEVDPGAHREYLRGRYYWNKRDGESYRRALEHFQRALDIDPAYAPVYAGMADCYLLLTDLDSTSTPVDLLAKARVAAQKGLEIDPSLAEARTSLGLIEMKEWNWAESERQYLRAIELAPSYATAHHWYAEYLNSEARVDEALREIGRAEALDPLSPMIATDRGKILYYGRRHAEAIAQLNKVVQDYPRFSDAYFFLTLAYTAAGRHQEALAAIDRFQDKTRISWAIGLRGCVLARMGRREEALQVKAEMERQGMKPFDMDLALGQYDEALSKMEMLVVKHLGFATSLKVEPTFDPVRGHPRFQRLLKRVGLAP